MGGYILNMNGEPPTRLRKIFFQNKGPNIIIKGFKNEILCLSQNINKRATFR